MFITENNAAYFFSKISEKFDALKQKMDNFDLSNGFKKLGGLGMSAAMAPLVGPIGTIKNVAGILGFASGTASAPPGTAWVGEDGPELVNFRGGEQVLNKEQILRAAMEGSASRGSGDVYNITINADLKQLKDVQALIDSVKRARQVGRARGCRV